VLATRHAPIGRFEANRTSVVRSGSDTPRVGVKRSPLLGIARGRLRIKPSYALVSVEGSLFDAQQRNGMTWPEFQLDAWLGTLASLTVAFILGALIGFERQVRQRNAGLRTNTLVAVGAAVFVDLAVHFHQIHGGTPSPLHVVAYVVSGIGFLGAGAIMKEGANVTGLNTAATLWGSAAVGCCAGAKLFPEAATAAAFVLLTNTLLRPVVHRINRNPLTVDKAEARYCVSVVCLQRDHGAVRARLVGLLDEMNYPARSIEQNPFGLIHVEVEATLFATEIDTDKLDEGMAALSRQPGVLQAVWYASAEE
jgi:putative Mg2+ transporter-C (MgtC) family protein